MIKNMNYKLLLVYTVLIQICWAKSDCEGGLLKCFGESVGNLTKMYEDTNNDVIFNFKIDISAMNSRDIRNLLIASNASLFSDRIDFVDGAAPSRTTIVQLAEVLRNELKKNDVDLTESKLFMKVNNYSTIEVQIFDFIDEDDDGAEESKEDNVDNSTLTLNVNIIMKNSTVNLMDDKGEKISTNENDDYVYVDLQERLEFGKNKTSKEKGKEKNGSKITDTDAFEQHVKWNKDEKEKSNNFDADDVIEAKKAEHKQWNKKEKESVIHFDTDAIINVNNAENKQQNKDEQKSKIEFDANAVMKAKKAEYEQWKKDEEKKTLEFNADAVMKAKKAEYEQRNKDEQKKLLANAVIQAKKVEHEQWNKEEIEKLTKFDDDAAIRAKKAEHEQWNKDEKEKLIKYDVDAVIRTKKEEHEHWNKEEKDKLFKFDADAVIKSKEAEHKQWNKEEEEKLLEFDIDVTTKPKIEEDEFDADAVIKAKKAGHKQWNKDEIEKLMKFDDDAVIRAKKKEHEQWTKEEKDKLFKFDADAVIKGKEAEHKQWNKEEKEKLLEFDIDMTTKPKIEEDDESKRNEKEKILFHKFEEIINDEKEQKEQEEHEMWNPAEKEKLLEFYHTVGNKMNNVSIRQDYESNNKHKEISDVQLVQEKSKLDLEKEELIKYYGHEHRLVPSGPEVDLQKRKSEHEKSAKSEKDMEYDVIEENIENMGKMQKTKYKEEKINEERRSKAELSKKEIIKEHEQWNETIQEKLKELEKLEDQDIEIVTENMAMFQKEVDQEHGKEIEMTGSKYFEVEIVTENNQVNNSKLSIKPVTIKNISDDRNSEIEDQNKKGEENDNIKKFEELERKLQEQKDLILKLKRLQKLKEQQMNAKYTKLKLGQKDDDEFTTPLPTESNDNAKAKVIEEDLLFKANLNRYKAKMVYHVVTERITVAPSIKELEKEEEDLNPIDGFYYDMNEDNQTSDYLSINYLDLFKDTTNEEIPYTTLPPSLFVTHKFLESIVEEQKMDDTAQEIRGLLDVAKDNIGLRRTLITPSEQHYSCNTNVTKDDLEEVVFPWIAAVFVRNGTTNAFEYVCDGAVISDRAVITAAHCLSPDGAPRLPQDVIIILGKRNQRDMTSNDIHKVSEVLVNAYYSVIGNHISHDLAIVKLETPIVLSEEVAAACMLDFDLTETDIVIDAITSGWNDNGDLTAIHFETLHNVQNNTFCLKDYAYQHVFCDTIGFEIQLCPSYGGIYAIKLSNHNWYLKGILSADTSRKGVCVDRNLRFTNLGESEYKNWLKNVIKV